MREVDDDTPLTPAEAAELRAAQDKAWAAFVLTPAWGQVRQSFERQRRDYIRKIGQLGLSDGDRAVTAGVLWTLEQFLSAPEKALQRLRMQAPPSDAPDTSTRPADD